MATDRVVVPADLSKVTTKELLDLKQRLIESKRDIEMQFGANKGRRVDHLWKERAKLALGHIEKELTRIKRELMRAKPKSPLMQQLADFFKHVYLEPDTPESVAANANKIYQTIKEHYLEK